MKQRLLQRYYRILAWYARKYIAKHHPLVIGVNGSVGKTSCRMIIAQTVQKYFPEKVVYTSSKNFNGELGLSLSIFCIESFTPHVRTFIVTLWRMQILLFRRTRPYDVIVLEYGIDRPGEMDFILSIVKPDIGIFTAIDAVHSLQFGDPSKIAQEESKMIRATKELAFLNAGDLYAMQLKDLIEIDVLTYQTGGYETDTTIGFSDDHYAIVDDVVGTKVQIHIHDIVLHVHTNILGKVYYGYIGVALTIADILSYKWHKKSLIDQRKQHDVLNLLYDLQPGRMSIFPGIADSVLIDSTYNASPLSMRQLINTVHIVKNAVFPQHTIWLVLGDMRELGDMTQEEHRMLAGYVQAVADKVFLVGELMHRYMYDELSKIGFTMEHAICCDHAHHVGELLHTLMHQHDDKCIVLFKGSQNTIFLEESIKYILQNPDDITKLPRQSDWWMRQKNYYFKKKRYGL